MSPSPTPSPLFIDAATLRARLPMDACIRAMRAAFADDTENPLRVALGPSLFMPGRVGAFTGIKVVSTKPGSPFGSVMVFDSSGQLMGIVDGAALTSLRTGAGSGLATALLARDDSKCLAMVGAGLISLHQVQAVLCARPTITCVRVWSRTREKSERLREELCAAHGGVDVQVCDSADAAVQRADVVCTATPSEKPTFSADAVRPGTHINAMGAFRPTMAEVPARVVQSARVFVDDRTAASREAGDLLQAKRSPDGTLADVLARRMPGRTTGTQVTLFKSVGIASQDVAAAVAAVAGVDALNM